MSKNTNRRIAVKWVRDKAKSAYQLQQHCAICNSQQDLELHHLHSITRLLEAWAQRCGYDISTDSGILAVRDEFIEQHHTELYELVYTLCSRHHIALHGVYGKAPTPNSVPKQKRWIELQRDKHLGINSTANSTGLFGEFC